MNVYKLMIFLLNSRGQYAAQLFTLRSTFLAGRPPKSVNMHWRRIPTSKIPIPPASTTTSPDSAESHAFSAWLTEQWRIKDALIEYYLQNGRFPDMEEEVETEVKLGSLWEVGIIFLPMMGFLILSVLGVATWNWGRYGSVWGSG